MFHRLSWWADDLRWRHYYAGVFLGGCARIGQGHWAGARLAFWEWGAALRRWFHR